MDNKVKKKRMSLPVRIMLIVLIILIVIFGVLIGTQLYQFTKMKTVPTGEIISGIYAIDNGMVNLYLVKCDDGYLMIDAGSDKNKVDSEFEKSGISIDEIKIILLTHTDSDHTAALSFFPDAQVYLSNQEVQMIDGSTTRALLLGKNKISASYQTLSDGETVDFLGLSVRGILTPGHTPGSMCYLINDKYLFTGDNLSLKDGKVDLFNSFFNMDDEIQRSSLRMLAGLLKENYPEYIFTAHYGYTGDVDNIAFKNWLQ